MSASELVGRVTASIALGALTLALPAAWLGGQAGALGVLAGGGLAAINFQWLAEISGTNYWLNAHPEKARRIIGDLNFDMEGIRVGELRADFDVTHLLIHFIGLCFIYHSNRFSLSQSLKLPLGDPKIRAQGLQHLIDLPLTREHLLDALPSSQPHVARLFRGT